MVLGQIEFDCILLYEQGGLLYLSNSHLVLAVTVTECIAFRWQETGICDNPSTLSLRTNHLGYDDTQTE